jgi:hypothetical protein
MKQNNAILQDNIHYKNCKMSRWLQIENLNIFNILYHSMLMMNAWNQLVYCTKKVEFSDISGSHAIISRDGGSKHLLNGQFLCRLHGATSQKTVIFTFNSDDHKTPIRFMRHNMLDTNWVTNRSYENKFRHRDRQWNLTGIYHLYGGSVFTEWNNVFLTLQQG